MRILAFLGAFVIFSASYLVLPGSASALTGQNLAGVAVMAGIGLLQIFIILFLFLFIPIAFIGMILRLLGFKKEGKGESWRWNLKQALFRFAKYFLYHAGLFGLWFIFLIILTGSSDLRIDDHYDPWDPALFLINGHLLTFLIYAFTWASVGPYIVYFWNQWRKTPTFKPSLGSYIRLALWNIFIFLVAGVIFQIILRFL